MLFSFCFVQSNLQRKETRKFSWNPFYLFEELIHEMVSVDVDNFLIIIAILSLKDKSYMLLNMPHIHTQVQYISMSCGQNAIKPGVI